jgi:hypothetical protein
VTTGCKVNIWPALTRQLEEEVSTVWSLKGHEPQRAMFSKVALGCGISSFMYPGVVMGRWEYGGWWYGSTVDDSFKAQFWNFLPLLNQSCVDNDESLKIMPKQWGAGLSKEAEEKFNKLRFSGSEKTIKQVLTKILYIKDKSKPTQAQNPWSNIFQEDVSAETLRKASFCLSIRSMIEWAVVEKIISHKLISTFAEKFIAEIGDETMYVNKKLKSAIEKTKNELIKLKEKTEAMELMGSVLDIPKVTRKSI